MDTTINTTGLALTPVGAALLLFFGIGGAPEKGGVQLLALEQTDEKQAAQYRRNFVLSRVGFGAIVLGTGLQIWSNYIR